MTTTYCEHNYPTSYTQCPICKCEKMQKDVMEVLRLIKDAMIVCTFMPVGGIGEHGATQEELIEAANAGGHYADDACYHQTQQAWLYLERARKILEEQ